MPRRPGGAAVTRAELAARIVGRLRESFGDDLPDCEVTVTMARGPRIAAIGGSGGMNLTMTVEISIDEPDAAAP